MIKEFEAKIAERMLSILDMTALNLEIDGQKLCDQARSSYGAVASLCILPKYVAEIKPLLAGSTIQVSTVANFPTGDLNTYKACDEIRKVIASGADEIDVVFPYYALLNRQAGLCLQFIKEARKAAGDRVLKVIIETGALESVKWIRKATEIAIRGGADFIQTSTGRHKLGATLNSAEIIINVIKDFGSTTGIKVSGGIRTYVNAAKYLELVLNIMGSDWVTPNHFRIGSSTLHHALLEIIES